MSEQDPVVGVDLGGTKTLEVVIDASSPPQILSESVTRTPDTAEDVIDMLCSLVEKRTDEMGGLGAVGIGLAALLGPDGVPWEAPNAKAIVGLDVAGEVRGRLGVATVVDNDANTAALAARELGVGHSSEHLLLITLGTGIGGGFVLGGELYRGYRGSGGEPGHMVIDVNGPECPCGQRGCWERYASGSGLAWLAREAIRRGDGEDLLRAAGGDPRSVTGELVVEQAEGGDGAANGVLDSFAFWIALGIANLVNILDPEVVVIGGGLTLTGNQLVERVRYSYEEFALAARRLPPVEILMTNLGPQAGALGAALLARSVVG